MKSIKELTENEKINLLLNNLSDMGFDDKVLECALCGKTNKARYYYICDRCNEGCKK